MSSGRYTLSKQEVDVTYESNGDIALENLEYFVLLARLDHKNRQRYDWRDHFHDHHYKKDDHTLLVALILLCSLDERQEFYGVLELHVKLTMKKHAG
jgi:hypothetical protein